MRRNIVLYFRSVFRPASGLCKFKDNMHEIYFPAFVVKKKRIRTKKNENIVARIVEAQ